MVISALLRITAPCEGCLKSLHTALSLAMGAFSCNLKQMIWGRITGLYLRNSYSAFLRSHFLLLGCRMNRAPTTGYESDVGSKTTHQFVYPESYKELAENVSMILIPFKTLDLRWVVTALTTGTINLWVRAALSGQAEGVGAPTCCCRTEKPTLGKSPLLIRPRGALQTISGQGSVLNTCFLGKA